jgi:hypothetical protein
MAANLEMSNQKRRDKVKRNELERIQHSLLNALNDVTEGELSYTEFGEYVYSFIGYDLLKILADLLEGEKIED